MDLHETAPDLRQKVIDQSQHTRMHFLDLLFIIGTLRQDLCQPDSTKVIHNAFRFEIVPELYLFHHFYSCFHSWNNNKDFY